MIKYDKDYVQEHRNKAITKLEGLEVGETYYSAFYGEFRIKRFLTDAQHWRELNLKGTPTNPDNINWFEIDVINWKTDRFDGAVITSLRDNNVGASYNPWLIFKDKEAMEEYKKGLHLIREPFDDMDDIGCEESSNGMEEGSPTG